MNFPKLIEIARAMEPVPNRHNHFSFIIYKGRIMVISQNNTKTHTRNLLNPKYSKMGENISWIKGSCSEFIAAMKLKRLTNIIPKKCMIVNVRIGKENGLLYSHPCQSCQSLLTYLGFKKVWYSTEQGFSQYYS